MDPLTGRAASEALAVYARLGHAGARFDGSRVASDVRTRRGRIRIITALVRAVHTLTHPASRGAHRRAPGLRPRLRTVVLAAASPPRPASAAKAAA